MSERNKILCATLAILFSCGHIFAQNIESSADPALKIVSQNFVNGELQIGFELANFGVEDVLFAANPSHLNGTMGYYISLDKNDASTLELCSCVYPDYPWVSYSNHIRVELKQLRPGKIHFDKVKVRLPTRESTPPYNEPDLKFHKIIPANIKQIRLKIGYFREDENTLRFTNIAPSGWYVRGSSKLPAKDGGYKTFLDLQKHAQAETAFSAK